VTAQLADRLADERLLARRRAGVPAVSYPSALPITARKDEILAAVRDSQVVIVAGETGSGKTTQLPKICLELGRGVAGMIGHTQPRRLAARTVAERIAEELGTPLGGAVGYQVRFTDHVGPGTLVKLMTDGILLAEIQRDRMLRQYDTLIVDEAHERSLNIDFILGYLKQLLPRRPDLKLIITSATIDPERFSRHFDGAPVIEVSGRTYPVEVRYQPLAAEGEADRDQIDAICDAVHELRAEPAGDILVFLSGEREIRDTADALRKLKLTDTELLPLYARLSAAEQHRVFQPHPGRRIVLATNVAETSLTVPGIRYVIDPGTARISRYSHRTKVQRLPIERISQASADQRKGRCGRLSDGICIRLYAEDDYLSRPEFTDPEILRTNLASVILQMAALRLGDVAAFPFLDPPDRRNIRDGVQLLEELHALDLSTGDIDSRLTPLGRKLARLPVDPRLARMVLAADRNGCVHEVMVIAAGLSIQDPRERPAEQQQAADELHGRFADPGSDFLAYLNLWNYLTDRQQALSSSQFRRLCRAEFLHYLRVREWQDLVGQLRQLAKTVGVTVNTAPAAPEQIHLSLLAGLLSHIGLKDGPKQDYLGARNARFAVFPGSALFKKPPRWVMAAELVETSRLWARVAARIEPEWAEQLAGHLVLRVYSEPHWDARRGAVMAYEKVTLYGVPLATGRRINYGGVDPTLSRELFIRHALVEGDWQTQHQFFQDNRALLAEVEDLEQRARRRDILVDDETLFDFYDRRIGPEVVSARHFDSWWKKARRSQPDLLTFRASMLISDSAGQVSELDFPDTWRQDGVTLALSYQFEPGSAADGVTVHIPLPVLPRLDPDGFGWQVPGLRAELITALIRSLPKPLRRNFVPAPDYGKAVLDRLAARAEVPAEPLPAALERELHRMSGVRVPREAWQPDRVPDHLRMTFQVLDARGATVAEGKDLAALQQRLKPTVRAAIAEAADTIERDSLREWGFGSLPRTVELTKDGHRLTGYPALVSDADSVAIRVLASEAEQQQAMWPGIRRLLLINLPSPVKYVSSRLDNHAKLTLRTNPHGNLAALMDDCIGCALDRLIVESGGLPWDGEAFGTLLERVRPRLNDTVLDVVTAVDRILRAAQDVQRQLAGATGPALAPARADVQTQLSRLVYPGFVTGTGWRRLPDALRYLAAIGRRLEKLPDDPGRDAERMLAIAHVQQAYQQVRDRVPAGRPVPEQLAEIRWMIEELRVSYFAQTLRTAYPVSEQRIARALAAW
jgi:ATP-dependent helicase HrpA